MKPIAILMRASGPAARVTTQSPYGSVTGAGTCSATYTLNSNGTVTQSLNGGAPTVLETWMLRGPNTRYAAYMHLNSGTSPTGDALDTELVLSSSRSWTITKGGGVGLVQGDCTIQIRDAVTHVVLASASILISAERS